MTLKTCFLLLCLAQTAFAIPAEGIRAKYSAPVTPIGGVLMVPLLSEVPGDNWPSTLTVTFEDGTTVEGHIGWIEHNIQVSRFWAENPLTIRGITTEDDTSKVHPKDSATGPVLLAQLPNKTSEHIKIGNDVVAPVWFSLPTELPNLNLTTIDMAKTLPSKKLYTYRSANPLDYWRLTLIASRRGILPPKIMATFSAVEKLAAVQGEQLWRIAFDRLARSSRGGAAECRDLLTNTGHDQDAEFACWATNTDAQLLSVLLDPNATSRQLASRALHWCANQKPFIFWLESVYGEEITVAIANPTFEVLLVAIKWKKGNDIPIAVEVPAHETVRIPVTRVSHIDLSLFGPTTMGSTLEWLELQIGAHLFSLPIVPATVIAHPPSVQLQPLYPCWNLLGIQNQTPTVVQPSQKTVVQLRKLFGKWEFFVSCSGNSEQTNQNEQSVSFYNPALNKSVRVSPLSHSSTSTNWTASVPVPEEWIVDDILQFSVTRKHGLPVIREHGPVPSVPWLQQYTAPIVVDLSEWDTIQKFPDNQ